MVNYFLDMNILLLKCIWKGKTQNSKYNTEERGGGKEKEEEGKDNNNNNNKLWGLATQPRDLP